MLGSGLLRDGTSTEKESRQRCSVDGDAGAAFLRKNRCGDDLASYMYVPQNSSKASGYRLCVFESWRK